MDFPEYLEELSKRLRIWFFALILFMFAGIIIIITMKMAYDEPSSKWLSTFLSYFSIPALLLFLIVMGYYNQKYRL